MKRLRFAASFIALVATLSVSACAAPNILPAPSSDSSISNSEDRTLDAGAGNEYSTLDADGVDNIRQTLQAKLDMTSGNLKKSDVGLEDTSSGPEINTQDTGLIYLTIDGPNGQLEAETDRIRFNTTASRDDFSVVTYFLTTDSTEEYITMIREGVDRYGIDSDDAERWIASVEASPAKKTSYSLTAGTALGLEVNYDLRYDGSKETQVIIVSVAPVL